jgi:hypothetical protein
VTDHPDRSDDEGHGPDDADVDHPLTPEDILARAGAGDALDKLPASESQATKLVALARYHYRLLKGSDGRP